MTASVLSKMFFSRRGGTHHSSSKSSSHGHDGQEKAPAPTLLDSNSSSSTSEYPDVQPPPFQLSPPLRMRKGQMKSDVNAGDQKYGYEDAAPDVSKYEYGDAAPKAKASSKSSRRGSLRNSRDKESHAGEERGKSPSHSTHSSTSTEDKEKYGYGDAAPSAAKYGYEDAAPSAKYGYEDAAPSAKYGYEEAAPSSKYGYEEAAPSVQAKYGYGDGVPGSFSAARRAPRRSSMKSSGGEPRRRRASMQMGEEVEVRLPMSDAPIVRRSSISFDNKVRVKNVAPVSKLAKSPEQLWFQDDEYDQIKRKSWLIVDKVEGGNTGHRKYCTRGLERMMAPEYVREKKNLGWGSVLDEQDLQRENGIFDENYMASLYRFTTARCQEEAAQRGQDDAAEVEQYLSSMRKYCRRLSC